MALKPTLIPSPVRRSADPGTGASTLKRCAERRAPRAVSLFTAR